MRLWLFAFAVIVGLALLSIHGLLGGLLGLAWGFVVFPHGLAWLMRRGSSAAGDAPPADYWCTSHWQSGAR